ncbi:hypothetical protein A0H81_14947 [Grifola frondosa]|uniref:Uncharacterized protein n=1 Tax=Grifola frondosa TaxID=5627 RepID=A0A1C7LMA3_GRIFR|nr:hypothetical protein A0H81_14947 [Grifola frondosa]
MKMDAPGPSYSVSRWIHSSKISSRCPFCLGSQDIPCMIDSSVYQPWCDLAHDQNHILEGRMRPYDGSLFAPCILRSTDS